jgi:transcriptional regulator with XRE-family HTH domain
METINKKVTVLREFHAYSTSELANHLGISQREYEKKEKGVMDFTSYELMKLAEKYDVLWLDLFGLFTSELTYKSMLNLNARLHA